MDEATQLIADMLVVMKAKGVDAPLTISRAEQYLSELERKAPIKPCPVCLSRTISIGSQNLKMCSCGWKDPNWTRDKNQPPLYG